VTGVEGARAAGPGAAPSGHGGEVDLHVHSTASDGALAPETVVEAAARVGLSALALTDHDTLAGVAAAREAGNRLRLRVVAGVELSVLDGEQEVHLLGLHVARVDALERDLAALRETRRARAVKIVERLNALGVPVTADQVFAESGAGAVGRPHVARALIAGGWVRDLREAFGRYLGTGRPANVEKQRLSAADGIRRIHDAGGLAVFAHPGADGTLERVAALAALGLDGLEVLHPSHSPADVARLTALTESHGLVPSGGSDWHGTADGPRALGAMRVPAGWLASQDARLAARASRAAATFA